MSYLIYILALAGGVPYATFLSAEAVIGMIRGRIKTTDTSQPWLVFREHPVKFAAGVMFDLGCACWLAVLSVRVASDLLHLLR
jgi:hypothetical protein